MLLDLIAAYYKYLWIAFGVFAMLKILLAWSYHGALEGMNSMIFSIFRWYGTYDMEVEEEQNRRSTMVFLNWITIFILLILVAILLSGLLLLFLGR